MVVRTRVTSTHGRTHTRGRTIAHAPVTAEAAHTRPLVQRPFARPTEGIPCQAIARRLIARRSNRTAVVHRDEAGSLYRRDRSRATASRQAVRSFTTVALHASFPHVPDLVDHVWAPREDQSSFKFLRSPITGTCTATSRGSGGALRSTTLSRGVCKTMVIKLV